MATDVTVTNLIINKLTKSQYDGIASKSDTELYLIPDETDASPLQNSTNTVSSGGVYTALQGKQDALVSGTNIKTINNTSLLGSGDISVGPLILELKDGTISDSAIVSQFEQMVADENSLSGTHVNPFRYFTFCKSDGVEYQILTSVPLGNLSSGIIRWGDWVLQLDSVNHTLSYYYDD